MRSWVTLPVIDSFIESRFNELVQTESVIIVDLEELCADAVLIYVYVR